MAAAKNYVMVIPHNMTWCEAKKGGFDGNIRIKNYNSRCVIMCDNEDTCFSSFPWDSDNDSDSEDEEMSDEISDFIENFSPEDLESIRRYLIDVKIEERSALGWDKVHKELQEIRFCQEHQKYANIFFLFDHIECENSGHCKRCIQEDLYHKA